ncbi:hypothetical protein GVM20_03560 [Porphyrobacter sp. SLTP]|nr:hypothetical protein [Porphyrobacter sp. SLTP]NBB24201.1 hypothetical protein [Porphyrobacter sp. SLTP]
MGCAVTLDGAVLQHGALFEASWREILSWPAAEDGKDVAGFSIFNVLRRI